MPNEQLAAGNRIVQDLDIMLGKPVVRGTRIPVDVVIGKLAENPDPDDLFTAHPRLTLDDVKACLTYANQLLGRTRLRKAAPREGAAVTH